ncbi:tRNA A37 threonylcarbamoyladenosine dehydratase [Polaromonas sp. CG_9.5]|uniref:tRNA threonylcarbamoyladenosine dehydratase n=1 Tax=Polaromonas sp. CG_9.5 TaxID=3071705 RepID=UPI002E0924FB|nr:tRNA A37 threonylcarbamoyladenosine dehydratase [Polaromonas sp. CG_9.5]
MSVTVTPSHTSGTADPDMERRFGSLARLYGPEGAQRIRAAHIVVVGLGGVGSWAAEAASRSGVARLTLIDLDHIAESNINRQVHALGSTVGQSKVQAMRERIAQINPHCQVDCIEEFVDAENWPALLSLDALFDRQEFVVIDACDQVKAKSAMAAWAIKNKVSLISVGAAGGKRLAHRVDIDDLSQVTHDPLLAQMRYRLRKEHGAARVGKMGVMCVFSREEVLKPNAQSALNQQIDSAEATLTEQTIPLVQTDGTLNCHGYGSIVCVTSTFGMCAASWALNKIAGIF